MTKKLIKNTFKCLYCEDIIESKRHYDYVTCNCGKSSCDGGDSYTRLIGDLNMIERIEVWEDGDKIRCIDDSQQNTLKLNEIYTVDTSMNTTEDRVYVKENKRFSFLKSRFKLLDG